MRDIKDIPTGRMMYMKHADGSVVEYGQWASELVMTKISFLYIITGRHQVVLRY